MDIDAYVAAHKYRWDRLAQLTRRPHIPSNQVDEFIALYQASAADLAVLSSGATDPDVVLRLSNLLGRARSRMSHSAFSLTSSISRFGLEVLPLAIYRIRWLILAVALSALGLATLQYLWLTASPQNMEGLGSEAALSKYAQNQFTGYYSEYPKASFTGLVWSNNSRLALLTVAGGITGVFPVFVLFQNFVSIGTSAAILAKYGQLGHFFEMIIPHGLMELSALLISVAIGLRIFWVLIVPGEDTRINALAKVGRQMVIASLGMVIMLGVSGIEEGFLTPSNLNSGTKIAIAVIIWIAFFIYIAVFGRRAYRRGLTGDLEADQAGYQVTVAS